MGVARTVYIRRAVSRVLSSSSLHATACILFGISTSSPFPPFPPFPPYLRISDARLAPPVPVRHIRPTLSVSLSDTSVRRCPSPCPTRPSDTVHLFLLFPFPFPFPFPFRFPFPSRSCSRSCSIPVPIPVFPPASAPALACVTRTHSSTLENRRHYTRLHLLF